MILWIFILAWERVIHNNSTPTEPKQNIRSAKVHVKNFKFISEILAEIALLHLWDCQELPTSADLRLLFAGHLQSSFAALQVLSAPDEGS